MDGVKTAKSIPSAVEEQTKLCKRGKPDFRLAFLSLVDALCHVLALSLVIYLFWDCLRQNTLIAWHAPLTSLAYVFFLTEGMLAFLPHSVLTRNWGHIYLVKLHWILQLLGLVCTVVGVIIIFVFKNMNNARHFKTPHSIVGLVAFILALLVSFFGVWTRLHRKYHLDFKLSHLKLIHAALGVVAYGVGMATQILGYFSFYFKMKHDVNWRTFLSVNTGLLAMAASIFACASLFRRIRLICSRVESTPSVLFLTQGCDNVEV